MKKTQITRSPIDNSIYVERDLADKSTIDKTLKLANQAQKKWRNCSVKERAEYCHKMIAAFAANEDQIAEELTWMMGRPIRYSKGEVVGMIDRAQVMIANAEKGLATIELSEKSGFRRYIKREALGTVFVVAPWNYPYLTAINVIIPAIMAGNSVILKHSAQTPLCAEQLYRAFKAADLPKGVFQYLHLSHSDTEMIIKEGDIAHVAFTGSVAGGQMVENASSGRFISVGLELGGKDPAYVRVDAEIAHAVSTCIDGAFFNSGQSCCGIERIYVHSAIYDQFVEQAINIVNEYKLGRSDDPETTLGPVVKASAAEFIREQVKDAIDKGAKANIDVNNFPLDQPASAYLAPQLLTDVDHSMRVMTEESFGPVIGIMKVDSDQQAIELMNDSEFGLTASVFSKDIDKATVIGEQLDTGTFFINHCDSLDPDLAWTGVKNSGRGCTLSILGYEGLTRPKSYNFKVTL
jgi:acyl-CoA reductase-like NAD-dependent aldehyde dehydrogenase